MECDVKGAREVPSKASSLLDDARTGFSSLKLFSNPALTTSEGIAARETSEEDDSFECVGDLNCLSVANQSSGDIGDGLIIGKIATVLLVILLALNTKPGNFDVVLSS